MGLLGSSGVGSLEVLFGEVQSVSGNSFGAGEVGKWQRGMDFIILMVD